jgi:hypothetical protein
MLSYPAATIAGQDSRRDAGTTEDQPFQSRLNCLIEITVEERESTITASWAGKFGASFLKSCDNPFLLIAELGHG